MNRMISGDSREEISGWPGYVDGTIEITAKIFAPLCGSTPDGRAEGQSFWIGRDEGLGEHNEFRTLTLRILDQPPNLFERRFAVENDGRVLNYGGTHRFHGVSLCL
jgi:hypothetical protein